MLRRIQHANDIGTLRRRAEQFLTELATESYSTRAGLSETSNVAAIYARYADLASEALFNALRDQATRADGDERRRAEYLTAFVSRRFVVGCHRTSPRSGTRSPLPDA